MTKKLVKSIELDAAWNPHFSSDLHLFHGNAARHRGFQDTYLMHDRMVAEWNDKVPRTALVLLLGDVAIARAGDRGRLIELLNKLNGRKWLVPGNHDASLEPQVVEQCFERVLPMIQDVKGATRAGIDYRFVLSHFPLYSWNRMHHGAMHLHGHSHGNLAMDRLAHPVCGTLPRMMDVGIDTHPTRRLVPYSLEEVLTIMSSRRFVAVDHHYPKEAA